LTIQRAPCDARISESLPSPTTGCHVERARPDFVGVPNERRLCARWGDWAVRVETPLYNANSLSGIGMLRLRLPKPGAGGTQHDKPLIQGMRGLAPAMLLCVSVPLWSSIRTPHAISQSLPPPTAFRCQSPDATRRAPASMCCCAAQTLRANRPPARD